MNGLVAGGLLSAVPVSLVAKSPDMSLLHFFPVTDERSGRTPIWDGTAKQLVWREKRNTGWQCLMVEAKDLCNSFSSHMLCVYFAHESTWRQQQRD